SGSTVWMILNPPGIPVGGCVPYFGGSIPGNYALPTGQNLLASNFPAANAVLGTTYGNPGGGSFTMPDLRGRAIAHLDSGGSNRITVAGGNFDGTVLGNAGGAQNKSVTIAQANLPSVSFTVSGISLSDPTHTHGFTALLAGGSPLTGVGTSGSSQSSTTAAA